MTIRRPSFGLLGITVVALVMFFGLAALGHGGAGDLLDQPIVAGAFLIIGLAALASLFTGINLGGCVRADTTDRWKLAPLVAISLLIAVVPPFDDQRGIATIDGELTRWMGLGLVLVGSVLRVGPMFVLGSRFTWPLASQEAHELLTSGFYRYVRHPSYLGAFVGGIGWVLVFRSGLGIVLMAALLPAFLPVVHAEEALLEAEFGEPYRGYQRQTWRLVPFVY